MDSPTLILSGIQKSIKGGSLLRELLNNRKIVHCLMVMLVILWGLEFIAAKTALETLNPFTLTAYKYGIAAIILLIIRAIQKKKFPLKKKHIFLLILCAIFGDILYFAAEYTAMDYIPVSMISIILAFVPMLSIIIEIFVDKRVPNFIIVAGIGVCIIGVVMVIGVDFNEIFSGKWIGYLLAFSMVILWNAYNFITEKLSGDYEPYDLTFMQLLTATVLTLPFIIFNSPGPGDIDGSVIIGVLYLGAVCGCLGFLIYVVAIAVLGPTPCALYSNFLPVTTAIFGWIFLSEKLSMLQILGGVIVVGSAAIVIWQKGKLDEKLDALKEETDE